jgi:hypothetical protein
MPLSDNYIFDLDENVRRTPASYKTRFGGEHAAIVDFDAAAAELVGSAR